MAEVQVKSQGCLQLCQLSVGCGQEWSNEGDRRGAAGRGCTPEPHSPLSHPQRGLHSKSGLRKDRLKSLELSMAPQDYLWLRRTKPMTCLLKREPWFCLYFPNCDRNVLRYSHPTPKTAFTLMISGSPLKNKTNKTQLYNSRLLPIHITAKCNSLIYK